jgi:hypothetical protein
MAMHRREQAGAGDGVLVTECEAFLDGTLAEYWDERGVDVPVWAWTNLLAHGSQALIGESVARPTRPRRGARSWRIARSYLAHQILGVTDDRYTVPQLQTSVLIPLELEMAARAEVGHWTPRQWVDTVDSAIRNQHPALEQ